MAPKLPFGLSWYSTAYHSYWFLRLFQHLFSFIGLCMAGTMFKQFQDTMKCNLPPNLEYNFALGLLTFLALFPIVLLDGPYRLGIFRNVRQFDYRGRFAFDAILFFMWIGGAVSSVFPCSQVCDACSARRPHGLPFMVTLSGLVCPCNGFIRGPNDYKSLQGKAHYLYESNTGIDSIVVVTFAILAIGDLFQPAMVRKLRALDGNTHGPVDESTKAVTETSQVDTSYPPATEYYGSAEPANNNNDMQTTPLNTSYPPASYPAPGEYNPPTDYPPPTQY